MPRKQSAKKRQPRDHAAELWESLALRFKTCPLGEPIGMLRVQAVELLASFANSPGFPPEFRNDEPVDDPKLAEEAREFRVSLARGLRFDCLRIPDGSPRHLPELAQDRKDLFRRCVMSWISALYALVSTRSSFFAWDAKDRILDNLRPGRRFLTVDIRDIEANACRLLATILVVEKRSSGIPSQRSKAPKPKVELDAARMRMRVGRKWHDVTPAGIEMLKVLFAAKGEWVAGKTIGRNAHKTRARMPKPVAKMIESHQDNGYRIPSLLPQ